MNRKPDKDWFVGVKEQLDAPDGLEEVEGVQVNQFQIYDESRIVFILKAAHASPEAKEVVRDFFTKFFAPAKIAVLVLEPGDEFDVKVFNPPEIALQKQAVDKA